MVIGYHIIMTAYGWWLPNDPRGSTSHYIASNVIADLGELHFGRKRIQPASREIRAFYIRAEEVLKFPLLIVDADDRKWIAEAFEKCIVDNRYTCYACAIMQDQVHILLRKHKHMAEAMIENLQQTSARLLHERGLRTHGHPVWCSGGWKVFLDEPDDIWRTIRYVESNPPKHRMPQQRFPFVQTYDNYPFARS